MDSLRSNEAWALALICAVGIALRALAFTGCHGFDDVYYINRAVELSRGHWDLPMAHWAARTGLVMPVAFSLWALGIHPVTITLVPMLCSLGGVAFTFVVCRRLWGIRAALFSAFLLATLPIDVLFASIVFPTELVALGAGVGIGCFLWGEESRQRWLYVCSGIGFGFAILAHESAALVLVTYIAHAILVARPHRDQALVIVGMALVLWLDPLVHASMGNPWARAVVTQRLGLLRGADHEVVYRGFNVAWLLEPVTRLFTERTTGLFTWLLAPLVVLRVARPKTTGDRALALILLVGFLWFAYGSVSPTTYAPLARIPRYMAPLSLPATWFLGRELAALSGRWSLGAAVALSASSLFCLSLDRGNAARGYAELGAKLRAMNATSVALTKDAVFKLQYAERFEPPYRIEALGPTPPTGLVVATNAVDRARLDALPGVTRIARVVVPDSLYLQALRNPTVTQILELTRPAERFASYAEKSAASTLDVYRVPEAK